jgi:YHS domain-containing protein
LQAAMGFFSTLLEPKVSVARKHHGETQHFCPPDCQGEFEADPSRFISS